MQRTTWLALGSSALLLAVAMIRPLNSQVNNHLSNAGWTSNPVTATSNERMLLSQGVTPAGANQVIVVDSTKPAMAVYWIAPDTGMIQLKSVRNLASDFQLEEFNGTDPSPSKIRSILTQPR
jgi:hypothetical protein